MLKNLFTLVLSFLCFSSFASTNVNGIISGNVTWTKANSPYMVTGNLLVDSFATLTIEPGTSIFVGKGFSFFIDGRIKAVGTATDSIHFASIIPGSQNWKGLDIRTSKPADTCNFQYCTFLYANAAIKVLNRNLIVMNCLFDTAGGSYIQAENCAYIGITNNFFRWGVNAIEVFEGGFGDISNNHFEGNGSCINISYSYWQYTNPINLKMKYNYFYNNNSCILGDSYDIVNISSNIFLKNGTGLFLHYSKIDSVTNNIFAYNKTGFTSANPIGYVSGNSFKHNNTAVYVQYSDSLMQFENNCLDSNDMNVTMSNSTHNMNFRNNYWGSADSAFIHGKIYDYYNDFVQGKVLYTPFLTQPTNDCQSVSLPDTTLSVSNVHHTNISITVSPNPFTNDFKLDCGTDHKISSIEIYSFEGRLIQSKSNIYNSNITIEMINYPAGVYIYKATLSNNSIVTGKLIKQ